MFTIQDYIDSLNRDKESLVANLTTKGISASDTETFTTLVPKVLDIISVNNQSKTATITSNTTTTITPDEGYTGLSSVEVTTNVALDLSEYFTNTLEYNSSTNQGSAKNMVKTIPSNTIVNGTNLKYAFYQFRGLTSLPIIDTSNVTDMEGMCNGCVSLVSFPALNTSNVRNMMSMFNNCGNLTTFPALSIPSVTNMQYMFSGCNALSDSSLDNILQMCTSATSYNGTKTLAYLYITDRTIYPTSRIEALPHYQDFINAGWTID